jgi:hypothetical protein
MTRIGGGGRLLGREWERRLGHSRREAYGDIERARPLSGPPVLLFSVPEPIDWRAGTVRHERRGLPPARSVSRWYGAWLV